MADEETKPYVFYIDFVRVGLFWGNTWSTSVQKERKPLKQPPRMTTVMEMIKKQATSQQVDFVSFWKFHLVTSSCCVVVSDALKTPGVLEAVQVCRACDTKCVDCV